MNRRDDRVTAYVVGFAVAAALVLAVALMAAWRFVTRLG